jgi:hypothetical protein
MFATNSVSKSTYGGVVWLVSSIVIFLYGAVAITKHSLPGVEELVLYFSTVDGMYVYSIAFVVMVIEGVYLLGNFFPGSSLAVILAILSQEHGIEAFIFTVLCVYIGWSVASFVNVYVAQLYRSKLPTHVHNISFTVIDRPMTTWYPIFRANYEVAQITEGGNTKKVLESSLRVKLLVTLIVGTATWLVPFFIDIHMLTNKDGFSLLFLVSGICFFVSIKKILSAKNILQSQPQTL